MYLLSWVPLAAARWHALAIASTAAWSQDTVLAIPARVQPVAGPGV